MTQFRYLLELGAIKVPKSTGVEQFYVLDEITQTPTPPAPTPAVDSLYTTESEVINPVNNNDKQHWTCYREGMKHLTNPSDQPARPKLDVSNFLNLHKHYQESLISYSTQDPQPTPQPSTITISGSGDMYADTTQAITSYDRNQPSYQAVNLYTTESSQITPEKPLNLYLPKTQEKKLPSLSKTKSHIWDDDQFEANPHKTTKK